MHLNQVNNEKRPYVKFSMKKNDIYSNICAPFGLNSIKLKF